MSTTLDFDVKAAADVDAIYSTPDVAATRVAVFRAVNPKRGENALDIGCGPGYLLRDLALAVGAAGRAVGVDISEPMLAMARERCDGIAGAVIENAEAGRLPAGDGSFDLACALQVYAYIKELDGALAELFRVLKPAGRVAILDTDFAGLVWQSRNRDRMRRILAAYDNHVAWPDLPRILPQRLRAADFRLDRCESVPFLTLNYHRNTYSYGIARFIHRFVTEHAGIDRQEADAWLAEFDELERAGEFMFSMNRFLFTASKPG